MSPLCFAPIAPVSTFMQRASTKCSQLKKQKPHRHNFPNTRATMVPTAAVSLERPVLVFVTPNGITTNHARALSLIQAALRGGSTLVQLRDREADASAVLSLASYLLQHGGIAPSRLVLNGVRAETIATVSPRLGLHAREADMVTGTSLQLPGTPLVPPVFGASVHSVKAARAAVEAGAGYLQVGTMFATQSHPGKIPEGPALMREVRDKVGPDVTLIGIGGIAEENVAEVLDAGADGVAVISLLADAKDPASAACSLLDAMIACTPTH